MLTGKKSEEASEEKGEKKVETAPVSINLADMYKFLPADMYPDIALTQYSNHTFIQVTERDVYLDFLQMPGIKKPDGKMAVPTVRIYLTHASALSLAEVLFGILEKVDKDGRMETYAMKKEKSKPLSTTIRKTTESDNS